MTRKEVIPEMVIVTVPEVRGDAEITENILTTTVETTDAVDQTEVWEEEEVEATAEIGTTIEKTEKNDLSCQKRV